jgi:hypothetical protein
LTVDLELTQPVEPLKALSAKAGAILFDPA